MSFELLKSEIIDTDFCEGCGLCAGLCKAIDLEDGVPQLTGKCVLKKGATSCGLCFEVCPQAHPEAVSADSLNPLVVISQRSTDEKILEVANNGGFVTTLLRELLKKKKIDAAVAVSGEKYAPVATRVTKPSQAKQVAGTRYSPSGVLKELANTIRSVGRNVAVVALPCEMRGVRRLEKRLNISLLKIGLFCSNNTRKNDEGKTEKLGACAHCTDFAAKHADIACGFAGSAKDFTSVIAHTEKGKELLEHISKWKSFESGEVALEKIVAGQKRKSTREIAQISPTLRERVYDELKTSGPTEIDALADRLDLTSEEIIYHLLVLQNNGHVHASEDRTDPYMVIWKTV